MIVPYQSKGDGKDAQCLEEEPPDDVFEGVCKVETVHEADVLEMRDGL